MWVGFGMMVSSVHWQKINNGLVGFYKNWILNTERDRLCFPENKYVSLPFFCIPCIEFVTKG